MGNFGELITWDFKSGSKLNNLMIDEPIQNFCVQWPYIVVCTFDRNGIKLMNLEDELLVMYITCGYVRDLFIQNDLLVVCGYIHNSQEDNRLAAMFWNFREMTATSKRLENISQKMLSLNELPNNCKLVGSDLITVEGDERKYDLMKRSFWP